MNKILHFLLIIYLVFSVLGIADPARPLEIFQIKKIEFQSVSYPWWNELRLTIKGQSSYPAILHNRYLNIAVYYQKLRITGLRLSLVSKKSPLTFSQTWEPINNAYQKILPGEYTVVVKFDPENFDLNFRSRWQQWKQKLEQKGVGIKTEYYQTFPLGGKEDYVRYQQAHKEFFIERMRQLNDLFGKLQDKEHQALRISQDSRLGIDNPFAEYGRFSLPKWQHWLTYNFIEKLKQEREQLQRHRKSNFAPIYPYTLKNMDDYCFLLSKFAGIFTRELYNKYRIQKDQRNIMAREQIENRYHLMRHIQFLHSKSAREMEINLRKELGYLPPPGGGY